MLDVLKSCLPDLVRGSGLERLQALIPSYGVSLLDDAEMVRDVRRFTLATLRLAGARTKPLSGPPVYLQTGS